GAPAFARSSSTARTPPSPWSSQLRCRAGCKPASNGAHGKNERGRRSFSLLLQSQFGDEALGILDLLQRKFPVILAAQIEPLLIEACHRRRAAGVRQPLLEAIVQQLDDARLHPPWPG